VDAYADRIIRQTRAASQPRPKSAIRKRQP